MVGMVNAIFYPDNLYRLSELLDRNENTALSIIFAPQVNATGSCCGATLVGGKK